MSTITQQQLRELLRYEPETGEFRWLVCLSNRAPAGSLAGKKAKAEPYLQISIHGKQYRAHRLAWLYMRGEFPKFVDHKNGVKTDNRFENLRPASKRENAWNAGLSRRNRSGAKGVSWSERDRKWIAQISVEGRQTRIGGFDTVEAAALAYAGVAEPLHREFYRSAGILAGGVA